LSKKQEAPDIKSLKRSCWKFPPNQKGEYILPHLFAWCSKFHVLLWNPTPLDLSVGRVFSDVPAYYWRIRTAKTREVLLIGKLLYRWSAVRWKSVFDRM